MARRRRYYDRGVRAAAAGTMLFAAPVMLVGSAVRDGLNELAKPRPKKIPKKRTVVMVGILSAVVGVIATVFGFLGLMMLLTGDFEMIMVPAIYSVLIALCMWVVYRDMKRKRAAK